ncbi:MAG: hypothetical protein P9M10_07360 [Candidatus Euphemobacter frigidus]|nr:hypothetical protein [Candidatus Euphemobacter frigidus]
MTEPRPEIKCPIFLKREWTIKELTRDINLSRTASDKAERAVQLKQQVRMLLTCKKYDEKNEDCRNCRVISSLREKTAELLIKRI